MHFHLVVEWNLIELNRKETMRNVFDEKCFREDEEMNCFDVIGG